MEKGQQRKKVLVAFSGGIDSAVSAYLLLKQGYVVETAFMKNWSSTQGLKYQECPWLADRQDALRVSAHLGVRMRTLDFEKQYTRNVMNYFFREYKAGRTPNPDVMCNKEIKFKLLYNWAIKHGFDYLATGHYARIVERKKAKGQKSFHLARSADEFKDQTYFIYNIKTEQLPRVLFPVGGMLKKDVRKLAKRIGLPNADRKESMGLCFVGKIRLKDFLQQRLKPKNGPIVDKTGKKIGTHQGLYFYTIGQRQGLQIGAGGPWYVAKKDLAKNRLVVTNNPKDVLLQTREVQLHSVNWISPMQTSQGKVYKLWGRFRHQQALQSLTVRMLKLKKPKHTQILNNFEPIYQVKFAKPQNAIASGQSLVFYKGKVCVGGGVIA